MKPIKKRILKIGLPIAALLVIVVLCTRGGSEKVQLLTATIEVQTINSSITATGTVEPITQVAVGTQVSGIVEHLYADYNSEVKKGQLLAELDRTLLAATMRSAENQMNTAKTEYDYQKRNYERYKALHDQELVSDADYEKAYYDYQRSLNSYEISRNDYDRAKTNLGYATIYSPIDGVVLSKEVEEGQTVQAAMNTPTLFTLAQDLTHMRVIADVDEADIGNVREGLRVSFSVDAYPEDKFNGEVTQVRQKPTVTNNVVTYEVVINAPNEALKLKPGLTANVTIFTMDDVSLLAVPNKAIRFRPTPEVIGKGYFVDSARVHKEDEVHKNLWQQKGDTLIAVPITTGITNGTYTEVTSGAKAGTPIITAVKPIEKKPASITIE